MASLRDRGTSWQVRHAGRSRSFPYQSKEERRQARADAQRWGFEQERRDSLGSMYEAPPESLGVHLDEHIELKRQAGLKPKTITNLETEAKRLEPLRDLLIPSLRAREVKRIIYTQGPGRTTTKALGLLKTVLRESEQTFDPAILNIKAPPYESRDVEFLTLPQVYELSSWLPDHVKLIVPVAALTGMRQGELFDLLVSDVDFGRGEVMVQRGKTKASRRVVTLSAEAKRLLKEQLLARTPGTDRIFPTETGVRWDKTNFMRLYREACIASELGRRDPSGRYEGLTFHHLRHTFVSLAASVGVTQEVIEKLAGWEPGSAKEMYAKYRHVYDNEKAQAVLLLDALMEAR